MIINVTGEKTMIFQGQLYYSTNKEGIRVIWMVQDNLEVIK